MFSIEENLLKIDYRHLLSIKQNTVLAIALWQHAIQLDADAAIWRSTKQE